MNNKQAKDLLQRYQTGDVNPSEKKLIEHWYKQLMETGEFKWAEGEKEQFQKTIESQIFKKIHGSAQRPRIYLLSRRMWWAAASVTLLFGTAAYFLFFKKNIESPQIVKTSVLPDDVQAPQTNKAMITLSDGQKVYLDSINNGALALQGTVKLLKLPGGEITYQSSGVPASAMQFNTLTNPKGSKVINMVMIDGTRVWLNAGSSLVYPVAFNGIERKVSLTGEGYFEVAKDPEKRFLVRIKTRVGDDVELEVLGTHFDVNAYPEEPDIKTTLLEGSVKIKKSDVSRTLSPGQQAVLTSNGVKVEKNVDLSQVMAWKDGFFSFNDIDIYTLMRQVVRWYDVDVTFEGKISEEGYTGKISRDVPLSKFVEALELNGLHIETNGRKITIMP